MSIDRQNYQGDVNTLPHLSTRQVAARIRHGKLPEKSPGFVRCACHPNLRTRGDTEALQFWSKGMRIGCSTGTGFNAPVPALAVYPALGIVIDTRL